MASSLIGYVFGKKSFKIVHEEFNYQYWGDLKILSVDILVDASVIDQPIAAQENLDPDGYINLLEVDVANGKIIQPTRMRVKALAPTLSVVEGLMLGFVDTVSTYTITTRSVIATGMYMLDLQLVQSGDNLSSTEVVIEWEQSAPPSPVDFDPANPSSRSRYGVRIQKPEEGIPKTLTSIGNDIKSGAEALFDKVTSFL